ncbi:hypothetical protein Dimus_028491 [Dionaea muscipula]
MDEIQDHLAGPEYGILLEDGADDPDSRMKSSLGTSALADVDSLGAFPPPIGTHVGETQSNTAKAIPGKHMGDALSPMQIDIDKGLASSSIPGCPPPQAPGHCPQNSTKSLPRFKDEDTGAQVAPIVKLEEVAVITGQEDEDPILDHHLVMR